MSLPIQPVSLPIPAPFCHLVADGTAATMSIISPYWCCLDSSCDVPTCTTGTISIAIAIEAAIVAVAMGLCC